MQKNQINYTFIRNGNELLCAQEDFFYSMPSSSWRQSMLMSFTAAFFMFWTAELHTTHEECFCDKKIPSCFCALMYLVRALVAKVPQEKLSDVSLWSSFRKWNVLRLATSCPQFSMFFLIHSGSLDRLTFSDRFLCFLSFQYSVWNVLWLGWNSFLICFYLNIGFLDRDRVSIEMYKF